MSSLRACDQQGWEWPKSHSPHRTPSVLGSVCHGLLNPQWIWICLHQPRNSFLTPQIFIQKIYFFNHLCHDNSFTWICGIEANPGDANIDDEFCGGILSERKPTLVYRSIRVDARIHCCFVPTLNSEVTAHWPNEGYLGWADKNGTKALAAPCHQCYFCPFVLLGKPSKKRWIALF